MSVLLLMGGSASEAKWRAALAAALPEEPVLLPGPGLDRAAVTVALVAAPPPGALAGLPGLRLIQSLWAGNDGLLGDPDLPQAVPLARLVDPALTASMRDSVLLHVLSLHRRLPEYHAQQAAGLWRPLPQAPASDCKVGVLGLGAMGAASAAALAGLGYEVWGWSRSPRALDGVRCAAGDDGLAALLEGCRVLVNLLPLTPDTAGLLSAALFQRLPPGAALVNLGRGRHLVEDDLLAALATGRLGHAVLDVLAVEPAPPAHPFWRHPRITLTPHVAASTDPASAAVVAARAVRALRAGRPIAHLIQRGRGY